MKRNINSVIIKTVAIASGTVLLLGLNFLAANQHNPPDFIEDTTFVISAEPSLADYERYAVANNSAVRSAFTKWQAAVERIAVARGLPNPQLSYGYFLESVETKVGPQEWRAGIMQMLPWFGKLKLSGDIQAQRAESQYQVLQAEVNDVLWNVRQVWYDAYYLSRAVTITQQNIDLVMNWEYVILTKYTTAAADHPDLIKTQIELIKARDDLDALEAKWNPLLTEFRAILNDNTVEEIHLPESLEFLEFTVPKDEVFKVVSTGNPSLERHRFDLIGRKLGVKRAKLNWFPDFGVGFSYVGTSEGYSAEGDPVTDSGKDPLMVSVSLSVPLWWGKNRAAVATARNERASAEHKLSDTENKLNTEVEKAWYDLEDSRRKVLLYRESLIPKSLESLGASEKAYVSDHADFLTLVDAQRRHLQFTLAYENALVRYMKSIARLEKLAGREL